MTPGLLKFQAQKGVRGCKDYQASIEKLRKDAAEAKLISDLATDMNKREVFVRLHQHLSKLADGVEQAMKSSIARTIGIGIGGHIALFH